MYNVHIGSITNILGDPDFFIGTGFLGEKFSTYEELKNLIYKYGKKSNGEWQEYIRLTFDLASNVDQFVKDGNEQCKKNGFVNLASICKKGPFYNYVIYFRPYKWIDKEGKTFSFVLEYKDKNAEPRYCKLPEILKEIGINT